MQVYRGADHLLGRSSIRESLAVIRRIVSGVVIITVLLTGMAAAGSVEDAAVAYKRGSYAKALKLFIPHAEQGDAEAQFFLGIMYRFGHGVPRDHAEAARWYRLAAEQGNPSPQFSLGVMYAKGMGVPQDYVLAHKWFNLAEAAGHEYAIRDRDYVAALMTPDQIDKAQRLALEWKPSVGR
jgi:uncharacterized protein